MKIPKKERIAKEVIAKAKSAPAGIDWQMLRVMRERAQHRKAS